MGVEIVGVGEVAGQELARSHVFFLSEGGDPLSLGKNDGLLLVPLNREQEGVAAGVVVMTVVGEDTEKNRPPFALGCLYKVGMSGAGNGKFPVSGQVALCEYGIDGAGGKGAWSACLMRR